MSDALRLRFGVGAELVAYLASHRMGETLLFDAGAEPAELAIMQRCTLQVAVAAQTLELQVEILQVIPQQGAVLRLLEPALLDAFVTAAKDVVAAPAIAPAAPPPEPSARGVPEGAGPVLWPIERLTAEWGTLSVAEKMNVAKHGQLAARRMILKIQDRQLQQYVLANPGITPDEVAAMAGMANLDVELLKRIASKSELTRHSAVVRALVTNPKLPMDVVTRILGLLPENELRRLVKTGRVRDAVKRLIVARFSG